MEPWNKPHIVKESSRGYDTYTLDDDLLMHRSISCVTEIDEDSVNSMIMQLLYLQRQDQNEEIIIYINSPGGLIMEGLALYDTMQAISNPIKTICMGTAASMASILFAAGDNRLIFPHSKVMIHDPRIMRTGGSALEVETISQNLLKSREIMAEILSSHTGRTVNEILEKTRTDSYFSAEEAVEFGLADEIITEIT